MTTNYGQTVYAQNSGTASTTLLDAAREPRNPTSADTQYPLGKHWVNTTTNAVFYHASQTTTASILQSVWVNLAAGSTSPGIDTIDTIPPDVGGNFTIESTDASISITGVPNGIDLSVAKTPNTYEGNSGGLVSPNVTNTIFINGNNSTGMNVVGNPGTHTLTVSSFQATTAQEGTVTLATSAQAVAGTDTANAVTSAALAAKLGTQTLHSVILGAGTTAALGNVGPTATPGQVLQSAGAAADPAFSTATYPLTTTIDQILYSSAANTVTGLATANDGVLVTSNTGVPSILAGPGTTGQVLQANAAAAPSFSTASYPSTTTANQILYSSATNTISEITASIDGVLITNHTGVPSLLANSGTPGWVLTANAGAPPSWQAAAASGITTIAGDTGTATGATVTFTTSSGAAGATVKFTASGSTVTLSTSGPNNNMFIGNSSGNTTNSGSSLLGLGISTLSSVTSGASVIAIGTGAALDLTTGTNSVFIGDGAGRHVTTQDRSTGVGHQALNTATTSSECVAIGNNALIHLITGNFDIAIGDNAGNAYTGAESNNIIIGNTGTLGESNVIRIGTQGAGAGQQNTCYIAGITGVSVANKNYVTLDTSTGQLGSEASTTLFSVNRQVFTSSGTYTPTAGMVYCDIEAVGGGGGGGSSATTAASTNVSVGAGGGAGEYARGIFSAATIGASKAVTIGTAGTAGSGGTGGTGGTTSVGATLISAIGGSGGAQGAAQTNATTAAGGIGGTGGTGGDFRTVGQPGENGIAAGGAASFPSAAGGNGGSSFFGGGGLGAANINNGGGTTGGTATSYGGGGGGAASTAGSAAHNGGAGFAGVVIITEYVIS